MAKEEPDVVVEDDEDDTITDEGTDAPEAEGDAEAPDVAEGGDKPGTPEKATDKPNPLADLQKERQKRRLAETELRRIKAESATGEEKVKNAARAEEQAKWKKLIANSNVRAALSEAGATAGVERLAKLVDVDTLDVDDDGAVDGLATQVDALKNEFPELFSVMPKADKKPPKLDASNKPPVEKKKSAADKLAETLTSTR